jgi:transposase
MATKGVRPTRQVRCAGILLLLNEGEDREGKPVKASEQSEAAAQCRCTMRVVYTVSKQYVKEGLERVLKRKTPPVPAKAAGDIEAKIIAIRCGEPPEGYSRWTLRLLESKSKAVIGIALSDAAIRGVLKRNTPEAPSERMPAHTAETKRGVCSQYGGCA